MQQQSPTQIGYFKAPSRKLEIIFNVSSLISSSTRSHAWGWTFSSSELSSTLSCLLASSCAKALTLSYQPLSLSRVWMC